MNQKTIKIIARKELIEIIRDGRFRVIAAIVFALLAVSLATGWKYFTDMQKTQAEANAATRRQWENQDEKNPHSAAHFGTYVFKPPSSLAYFDKGVDAHTGIGVWLEAHKQNPFLFRPAEDNLSVARFGETTAAAVLQLILPLVVVLLAFGVFAIERERGTLRQLLSVGISSREIAVGKSLGAMVAIGLLIAPAAVISVLALAFASGSSLLLESLPRFGLILAAYLLYLAIFLFVSLIVSARANSARGALVILLAFWLFNCLIVPRLASDLAERFYPTPSGAEFWATIERDMKDGVDGHNPASARTEEFKQKVLAEYNVTKVEDLPVNFAGLSLQAGEEYGNSVFDRRYGELWTIYERQDRFHKFLSVFAPLESIRAISMGVAGTDFAHHRDFARSAEEYRRMLNRQMNLNLAYNSRSSDKEYKAGKDLWSSVPEFSYTPPTLNEVLRRQIWNIVLLVGWFLLSGIFAAFAVAKIKT